MKKFILTSFCFTVLVYPQIAEALPAGAQYAGQETAVFSYDGRILEVDVDFGVYLTAQADWVSDPGGEYLYAYQLTNHNNSNVDISLFSACINQGASVVDIGSCDFGIAPAFEYFAPDPTQPGSAEYAFMPFGDNSTLPAGQTSNILYFTSNDTWSENGFGAVHAESVAGIIPNLPTPVPEPATITFLSLALATSFLRRGKKQS